MNSSASNSLPKLSKTLSIFFIIVQLLFGFRCGFIKPISNKHITIEKVYCIVVPGVLMPYFIYTMFSDSIEMVLLHYIEFYSCMIVLLITKYTLYDYLIDFATINKNLYKNKKDRNIGAKVMIFTILSFTLKCIMTVLFCLYSVTNPYCTDMSFQLFFYIWVTIGVDVLTVMQLLMIYATYVSVKNMETALNSGDVNVKQTLQKYIEITKLEARVTPMFDQLFMVGLLVNFPKAMFITYMSLLAFKKLHDWVAFLVNYSYAIHLGFLLCMPAAMGEMVVIQYKSFKSTLHDRLIQESDKQTRREIKSLLRYMCSRSIEHKVWHVIPLDLRLPASLFSMFITYLIIMIQFTHLFD